MTNNEEFLQKRVWQLEEEVEHLKKCKEFESNFQREIIEVGGPLIPNPIFGKTYSVTDAWNAIQQKLKEIDNENSKS